MEPEARPGIHPKDYAGADEFGRVRARIEDGTARFVGLDRDGFTCSIDGCQSRYRLEPHHIVHAEHHGPTDPDNLTLLCWFHHHTAIHTRGFEIDPHSPTHRRRLLPPDR